MIMERKCPLCDFNDFEERNGHVFCATCNMFMVEAAALPQLDAHPVISAFRRRAEAASLNAVQKEKTAKELEELNTQWYGILFAASICIASLVSIGAL